MPTLYHVTEWNKPFVYLTNPLALKNVAKEINYEFVVYSLEEFGKKRMDVDTSNESVFIFEAAYPQMTGITTKQLRQFLPNGKLVCLGGDTIWFLKRNQHHIDDPYDVDLWLDLLDEVVLFYNNTGLKADSWMWTISEDILNQCEEYTKNLPVDFDAKEFDFISLITVSTDYRRQLVKYFQSKNKKFATGVGCLTNNIEEIIDSYRKSWFHLGTTSPSWTTGIRTMKGFRDWLAPALNTLLIYDDFVDVKNRYGGGTIVPMYDYYNFGAANYLMELLQNDRDSYKYILEYQKLWLGRNTLEKQFLRKLRKHNIIPTETAIDVPSNI